MIHRHIVIVYTLVLEIDSESGFYRQYFHKKGC